jgi:hypothetical protein
VESVERRAAGSQLVANLSIGGTLVAVDSAREFEASGQVLIAGSTLDYDRIRWADEPGDGVTHDTLVLHAVSPVSGTARVTAAEVPGSVEFVAQVRPRGSGETVSAVIDHPLIDDDQLQPGTPTEVLQVRCEWRGSGSSRRLWLAQIIGRAPKRRGEFLVPGSAPAYVIDQSDPAYGTFILGVVGPYLSSGTLAFLDGGLDGSTPFAFVDGGLT